MSEWVTVVEHPSYLRRAEKILTPTQMQDIVELFAADPLQGVVIPGTGGCRKVRYAGISGRGKSGGVRIIHFFVDAEDEVHLLDIYAKGDQSTLSQADKEVLFHLVKMLQKVP